MPRIKCPYCNNTFRTKSHKRQHVDARHAEQRNRDDAAEDDVFAFGDDVHAGLVGGIEVDGRLFFPNSPGQGGGDAAAVLAPHRPHPGGRAAADRVGNSAGQAAADRVGNSAGQAAADRVGNSAGGAAADPVGNSAGGAAADPVGNSAGGGAAGPVGNPVGMEAELVVGSFGIVPSSPLDVPAILRRSVTTGSVTSKILHYYQAKGDLARTKPMVSPAHGRRPTRFDTPELRSVRMFVLSTGGGGLSQSARVEYWKSQQLLERAAVPALPGQRRVFGPFESTFPTPGSFLRALSGEQDRCLYEMGWNETKICVGGVDYSFHWRDMLDLMVESLEMAGDVRIIGKPEFGPNGERIRSQTMDSDMFLDEQANVLFRNKPVQGSVPTRFMPFMVGTQMFTDGALVSWNGGTWLSLSSSFDFKCCLCDLCACLFELLCVGLAGMHPSCSFEPAIDIWPVPVYVAFLFCS